MTLRVLGDDKGAVAALANVDKALITTNALADDLCKKLVEIGALNVRPTIDTSSIVAAWTEVEALNEALDKLAEKRDLGVLGSLGGLGGSRTIVVDRGGTGGNSTILDTIAKNTGDSSADAIAQTEMLMEVRDHLISIQKNTGDTSADLMYQTALLRAAAGAGGGGGRTVVVGGGGGRGGGGGPLGFRLFGTQMPLFGGFLPGILGTVGGFHLLIDSIIEVAAVLIPATIAMAAFGLAGYSAARGIYGNFTNAQTALDAVGGRLPALSGGFSAIQNAVKPQVFTLFGEGLSLLNQKTGEFGQLATGAGNALIQFVNRGVTALENSGLNGFAGKAVQDLTLLFHIIGNIGGIFGNLLRGMPGVADVLFGVLDKITGALENFTASPIVQGIERVVLGFHGMVIWGGLVASGLMALIPVAGNVVNWFRSIDSSATNLGRLDQGAGFFKRFQAGAADLGNALPMVNVKLGDTAKAAEGVATEGENASKGIVGLAEDAGKAGEGVGVAEMGATGLAGSLTKLAGFAASPWTWAIVGIGILAGLTFALAQTRTATENWIKAEQGMVDNSTVFNKMGDIQKAIFQTQQKLIPQTQGYAKAVGQVGSTIGTGLNPNLDQYTKNINDLSGAQQKFQAEQQRGEAFLNTMGGRFGMTAHQVEDLTVQMTGSQKAASQLWNSYLKGQMTLKQLVNEFYSYILATTGMVPTTERGRQALYALDKTSNETAQAISNVNSAEDKLLAFSTNLATGMIGLQGQFGALKRAADASGASMTGTNKASLALQQELEGNFIPSVQSTIDNLRTAHASTDDLRKEVAFALVPALDAGALKNRQFRDQIYQMAQEAGYHGVDTIKALTGWIDRNRVSAGEAAKIIRILGGNIDDLHNKFVKIQVSGQGTWNVQGLPGSLSAHIHGARHAEGAFIAHGRGPHIDDQLALLARGELVVPAHMVKAGMVDHLRGRIPGFAGGAMVTAGDYSGISATWPTTMMNATMHSMEASVANAVNQGMQQALAIGPGGGRSSAGGQYNRSMLEALWERVGGPGGMIAHIAGAIALAESGGNPRAYNPSGASGLWQILGSVYPGNLFNPVINAINAIIKYRDAGGFSPWVTYTSGAYEQYMDQGGVLRTGTHLVHNYTGHDEMIINPYMSNYGHWGGGDVYITVNGALDPDAVARQIQGILRKRKTHMGGQGMRL